MTPTATADDVTRAWVRDASDELAISLGCRFSPRQAEFVCGWVEEFCYLYEGDHAGKPMRLRAWQIDYFSRAFGWVKWDAMRGRWVRRFREASIWIPKKNGKSPTLAATGLYLLCGDGEPGQKVFIAAKDGTQAMIAAEHAKMMVEQSPELRKECDIHLGQNKITHLPSHSFLKPLSSSNKRTKASKQGLNGSILTDEAHVVDHDFMKQIERAGISRAEPLNAAFSTAGDDLDGWGYQQFTYGQKVAAGEIDDTEYLFIYYGAPQDTSDEEIHRDVLTLGEKANPTWNDLITPGEFKRDYEKSRLSKPDFLEWKRYRLNIWSHGANPWLEVGAWERCKGVFTATDLLGDPCWGGLDYATVNDMTAFALAFPDEEDERIIRFLCWFWTTQRIVNEWRGKIPFDRWVEEGWLRIGGEKAVQDHVVREEVKEIMADYDVRQYAYDPYKADVITKEITEGVLDRDGKVLVSGNGVERVEFRQNIINYAWPTGAFEKSVIEETSRHDGNPVLAWQMGHAMATPKDNSGNYRVVKPNKDGIKTVDGVQAAIMARALAVRGEGDETSVYEREDRTFFTT